MFKKNKNYTKILSACPNVKISLMEDEIKGDQLILDSLVFGSKDKIFVNPTEIKYVSEDGRIEKVLLKYTSYMGYLSEPFKPFEEIK